MSPLNRTFHLLPLVTLLATSPATAQIRASELGSISQVIDGTRISMEYSRPRARGRSPLFGKVVHWDEVWTPGANYATTLKVEKEIRLDGHTVPEGKYSLWLVVREKQPWIMVLDPDYHRFHMEPPDSNAKQIRFPVTPATGPFEETLSWRFDSLRVNGATLSMQWGTTRIAMRLDVNSSLRMQTPEAEARPFLGRYDWTWAGPDSVKKTQLVVTWANGWMMGNFEPRDPYFHDFALIRVNDDWYTFGLFEKGSIYEVVREWVIEFTRAPDGKVTLELRDEDDKLQATGRKRP